MLKAGCALSALAHKERESIIRFGLEQCFDEQLDGASARWREVDGVDSLLNVLENVQGVRCLERCVGS